MTRTYNQTRFAPTVLRQAMAGLQLEIGEGEGLNHYMLDVYRGEDRFRFGDVDEFLADLVTPYRFVLLAVSALTRPGWGLSVEQTQSFAQVTITAPERAHIARVLAVFQDNADQAALPEEPRELTPPPTVFIGHGRSPDWRALRDHLVDSQQMKVVAYEVGARAGHSIRDILDDMLAESSFAVLVMTGEDGLSDGGIRARQNVVHETGLFQGRLGFGRAVVVVQEGVELYSNLDGIQQIRYNAENIRESFGDVVATIRREFPSLFS